MLLVGDEIDEPDDHGQPIVGNSFLVLLNAAADGIEFLMPERLAALNMRVELDTASPEREGQTVTNA